MLDIKIRIASRLFEAINQIMPNGLQSMDEIVDMFEYPPDKNLGDLSFPCFKLSKILRKSPIAIAELLSKISVEGIKEIQSVSGYLNFFFLPSPYIQSTIESILSQKEKFGSSEIGKGKTVCLDYSSPNVAKPFHIGHLGTTVIGHSLKKIHEFLGYQCIGINHLGDWGTQFGKLIVAYNTWGNKEQIENEGIDALVALYVRFHKEAESDPSLNDAARNEFTKLETGDEYDRELWKWFIEISLKEYKKTYDQLGIEFDSYRGESFFYDKTVDVVKELEEKNLLKIDEGASVVDLSEYGKPPCLILKSDGSTLYATRDIAAALFRKNTYHFDKCIYVTDAGQSLHFAQWFKVIGLMGYEWENALVHVPYGKISINGQKLATRTGNVILLKDLFASAEEKVRAIMEEKNPNLENKAEIAEAVGVGAIVFHYLMNGRIKDMNFVLEDALSFEGNTGPYAQYTYARTCSVLSKAASKGLIEEELSDFNQAGDAEFELSKTLNLFPEKVLAAYRDYEPSVITRYILDVCAAFNRFYHECPILSLEDRALLNTRLKLTKATQIVLGNAFSLICLKKTEKI